MTVIDANSPADVLESFHVCSSHLLCVASVAGARESDYRVDEVQTLDAVVKKMGARLREPLERAIGRRDAGSLNLEPFF